MAGSPVKIPEVGRRSIAGKGRQLGNQAGGERPET
jgi:hypothetical protein